MFFLPQTGGVYQAGISRNHPESGMPAVAIWIYIFETKGFFSGLLPFSARRALHQNRWASCHAHDPSVFDEVYHKDCSVSDIALPQIWQVFDIN
jgi:hypothetical protein